MGKVMKITAGAAGIAALGGSFFAGRETAPNEQLTATEHVNSALEIANDSCRDDANKQLGSFVLDGTLTVEQNERKINKTIANGMISCVADKTGLTKDYVADQDLAMPVVVIVGGQVSVNSGN